MALSKSVTLPNGITADYWRVSNLNFTRANMTVKVVLDLYKDSTLGLAPLGRSHHFTFTVTQPEIMGNAIAMAYTKIKAMIEDLHPPINGIGDSVSYYPELVGAVDA